MNTPDALDRFMQRQHQAVLERKEFVRQSALEALLRIYAEQIKKKQEENVEDIGEGNI